ncbi:MAG: CHRD domain-containing protein [Gaiellaceae bacterium]
MKRVIVIATVFAVGLAAVGLAVASANGRWSQHANGAMEVPARDTQGQGQGIFNLSDDGATMSYKLIASNIENVFMAHIHTAAPGVNGPIVVWLYPGTAVGVAAPPGAGRTEGVLVEGTFTAADLTGPLTGQPLSALVELMETDNAYVNFHTNDGIAPTNTGPGDFPGGEIRGDIE